LRRKRNGGHDASHDRRDAITADRLQAIEEAERLRVARIEADFLARLAQRGGDGIRVVRIGTAAFVRGASPSRSSNSARFQPGASGGRLSGCSARATAASEVRGSGELIMTR
jgi:hypothetical protein